MQSNGTSVAEGGHGNTYALALGQQAQCVGNLYEQRGTCYRMFTERVGWHTAVSMCVGWGGELVARRTADGGAELAWIMQLVMDTPVPDGEPRNHPVWMALKEQLKPSDTGIVGTFVNEQGTPASTSDWLECVDDCQMAFVCERIERATVTVNTPPNADIVVSPTSLVFLSSDWNVPQLVTITAVDDAVVEGACRRR